MSTDRDRVCDCVEHHEVCLSQICKCPLHKAAEKKETPCTCPGPINKFVPDRESYYDPDCPTHGEKKCTWCGGKGWHSEICKKAAQEKEPHFPEIAKVVSKAHSRLTPGDLEQQVRKSAETFVDRWWAGKKVSTSQYEAIVRELELRFKSHATQSVRESVKKELELFVKEIEEQDGIDYSDYATTRIKKYG